MLIPKYMQTLFLQRMYQLVTVSMLNIQDGNHVYRLNARRGLNHRRWTLAEHDWTSIELGVSQQQAEHDPPVSSVEMLVSY